MAEQESIANFVEEIVQKSKTLREIIEILGPEVTSTDSETRESALKKLAGVISKLPDDFLAEEEVLLLLEFFLSRLEDSALSGGSVVLGLHHLVVHTKNLPTDCEIPLFQAIFKEGTVQSWSQKDRMRLFELLEFLLKKRIAGLKTLGFDFVLSFMRAASGERDPRCLVKIFQLYLEVVKNFDLGVFVEDMFELVACYFPVDYRPETKLNADEIVTREALLTGLESCLLSHQSFSLYVFQLVSEKILDDELSDSTKLEICEFLAKACLIFKPTTLVTHLDDYMTAFRSICLNPAERVHAKEIPSPVKNAIKCIVHCLRKDSENLEESLKSIADTSIENCEPFVLQAEMGLSGKALSLLQSIAETHEICARVILSKIFYWLGMLINANTVNAPQNKEEIIGETLPHIPVWLKIARTVNFAKPVQDALPGFFATFEGLEETAIKVMYQSAKELLLWKDLPKSEDITKFFTYLLDHMLVDLKENNEELRPPVYAFIRTYSEVDLENYVKILKECIGWDNIIRWDTPYDTNIKMLAEICCISIVNEESEQIFGDMIFSEKLVNVTEGSVTVELFKFNKDRTDRTVSNYLERWLYSGYNHLDLNDLGAYFQDIGYFLNNSLHEEVLRKELANFSEKFSAEAPRSRWFVLQCQNLDLMMQYLDKIMDAYFVGENPHLFKNHDLFTNTICPLYTAILNKEENWSEILEKYTAKLMVENPGMTRVCESRALFVAGRVEGVKMVEKLFENFIETPDHDIPLVADILDFEDRKYNPDLCKYKRTLMWKQRILCQFVPIYVRFFNGLAKDYEAKKSAFFKMLIQILRLARQIPVPQTHELLMILPIFCEALPMYSISQTEESSAILELVLDGLLELLKMAPPEKISEEALKIFLANFSEILSSQEHKIHIKLKTLDCLELMVKRCNSAVLIPYQSFTVQAIKKVSGSKKEVMRKKAATVRNLWELLKV